MGLILHVDGGSRGNPGPAGAGVVIHDDSGRLIHEGAYFVGRQTNNAAEYLALLKGLERLAQSNPERVQIVSDSELLVRQLTGDYRVKSPQLAPLFEEAQRRLLKLQWSARHVPRTQNARADELANLAMDRRGDVIVFDADAAPPEPPTAATTGGSSAATSAAAAVNESPAGPCGVSRVRIIVSTPPTAGACPAGAWAGAPLSVGAVFPAGVCVHATQTVIPTVLAIQNADPAEIQLIPTLTLRCTRNGCSAVFRVGPESCGNGKH